MKVHIDTKVGGWYDVQISNWRNKMTTQPYPSKQIVCRAIILNLQQEVLFGKRVRGGGVGKWALLGGVPDEGETPEQTIIREVKEETGLLFEPVFFKKLTDQSSKDRADNETTTWDVIIYYGQGVGNPIYKEDEVSELLFVSEDDLDKLDIAFNHKAIVKDYFEASRR